jgi:PilZ domain
MAEQKREHFRVTFPRSYHPSLELDSETYEIYDVSEFGVKFKVDGDNPFMANELVIASIIFPDDEMIELSGQIVRIDGDYVSMKLASPLPLGKIRAAHLHIIKNHMA